jgi:hypothetical protein
MTKETPGAAIRLRNFVPETDAVRVRKGFQQWAWDLNVDPVETLMVYNSGSASKMFACGDDSIWDVTATGDVGTSAEVTGQTEAYCSWINFTASGGTHYLVMVNGADNNQTYNGSAWATQSWTGVTDNDLIYIWSYKTRLWAIEKQSMNAYYGGVGAISGAFTKLELGAVFHKGGHLIAGGNWSVDSSVGLGQDELIVFVSSEGEVAVYVMDDPDDATTINLKGVYYVGRPLGQRCLANYGGDLLILTYSGLIPLSKVVNIDRGVQDVAAITAPIRKDFAADAAAYGASEGWEVTIFPKSNIGVINVPVSVDVEYKQYVWNLLTGAFADWSGLPSKCFQVFGEDLYFGGISEIVYVAETGSADDTAAITAELVSTFSQMGYPARGKQMLDVKPIVESNQAIVGGVNILTNYQNPDSIPETISGTIEFSGFTWGVSNWGEDVWPGPEILEDWQTAGAYANAIALHYGVTIASEHPNTDLEYRLIGFNVLFQVGGILGG